MALKETYIKNISVYQILLLYSFKYIICSGNIFYEKYEKCNEYINNLDIICKTIKENENGEYCHDWEINNYYIIFIIPEECYNKMYNLELLVDNYNKLEKKRINLYINKEQFMEYKNKELELFKNKKEDIKKCFINFNEYQKAKSLESNEYNEHNKNYKISLLCYYTMIDIFDFIEKNIILIKKKTMNKEMDANETIDYYLKNIKIKNIENIIKNIYEYNNNEKIKYFDKIKNNYKNGYFDNYNDNHNELEYYYLKSRKDCIEYGLKSIKDDNIICTKYE